jgi:ssRNA-specific RNase YbeY (16S rRNA maturation enzyme)
MIHGILHLCGFNDNTKEKRKEMKEVENEALNLLYKTF